MINDQYDIETCTWCNGEGKDLARKGQPHNQPDCIRCQGSGKIYVTSEMATTKKRRKYMGAVPKEESDAIKTHEQLLETDRHYQANAIHAQEMAQPKRRGRPPKVASGNNPTQ